jgi:hypothetical protein
VIGGSLDVRLQARPRGALDVRHVVEVVATRVRARGPAEVVDGERVEPHFCESEHQLLVERVQTAHVGQHEHGSPAAGVGWPCLERA